MTIEVHISKKAIEINRRQGANTPYVQVVNTRSGGTQYGHRVEFNGPAVLTWRRRPDGERHVYLETQSRVTVLDENLNSERTVTP